MADRGELSNENDIAILQSKLDVDTTEFKAKIKAAAAEAAKDIEEGLVPREKIFADKWNALGNIIINFAKENQKSVDLLGKYAARVLDLSAMHANRLKTELNNLGGAFVNINKDAQRAVDNTQRFESMADRMIAKHTERLQQLKSLYVEISRALDAVQNQQANVEDVAGRFATPIRSARLLTGIGTAIPVDEKALSALEFRLRAAVQTSTEVIEQFNRVRTAGETMSVADAKASGNIAVVTEAIDRRSEKLKELLEAQGNVNRSAEGGSQALAKFKAQYTSTTQEVQELRHELDKLQLAFRIHAPTEGFFVRPSQLGSALSPQATVTNEIRNEAFRQMAEMGGLGSLAEEFSKPSKSQRFGAEVERLKEQELLLMEGTLQDFQVMLEGSMGDQRWRGTADVIIEAAKVGIDNEFGKVIVDFKVGNTATKEYLQKWSQNLISFSELVKGDESARTAAAYIAQVSGYTKIGQGKGLPAYIQYLEKLKSPAGAAPTIEEVAAQKPTSIKIPALSDQEVMAVGERYLRLLREASGEKELIAKYDGLAYQAAKKTVDEVELEAEAVRKVEQAKREALLRGAQLMAPPPPVQPPPPGGLATAAPEGEDPRERFIRLQRMYQAAHAEIIALSEAERRESEKTVADNERAQDAKRSTVKGIQNELASRRERIKTLKLEKDQAEALYEAEQSQATAAATLQVAKEFETSQALQRVDVLKNEVTGIGSDVDARKNLAGQIGQEKTQLALLFAEKQRALAQANLNVSVLEDQAKAELDVADAMGAVASKATLEAARQKATFGPGPATPSIDFATQQQEYADAAKRTAMVTQEQLNVAEQQRDSLQGQIADIRTANKELTEYQKVLGRVKDTSALLTQEQKKSIIAQAAQIKGTQLQNTQYIEQARVLGAEADAVEKGSQAHRDLVVRINAAKKTLGEMLVERQRELSIAKENTAAAQAEAAAKSKLAQAEQVRANASRQTAQRQALLLGPEAAAPAVKTADELQAIADAAKIAADEAQGLADKAKLTQAELAGQVGALQTGTRAMGAYTAGIGGVIAKTNNWLERMLSLRHIVSIFFGTFFSSLAFQGIQMLRQGFADMITNANELEKSLIRLDVSTKGTQRTIGSAAGTVREWRQTVKDVGAQFGIFTTAQLAEAAAKTQDMTRNLGLNRVEMQKVLEAAAKLAILEGTDLAKATEDVSRAVQGFQRPVRDTFIGTVTEAQRNAKSFELGLGNLYAQLGGGATPLGDYQRALVNLAIVYERLGKSDKDIKALLGTEQYRQMKAAADATNALADAGERLTPIWTTLKTFWAWLSLTFAKTLKADLQLAFLTNFVFLFAPVVKAAVFAATVVSLVWEDAWKAVRGEKTKYAGAGLKKLFDDAGKAADDAGRRFLTWSAQTFGLLDKGLADSTDGVTGLTEAWEEQGQAFDDLRKKLDALFKDIKERGLKIADDFQKGLGAAAQGMINQLAANWDSYLSEFEAAFKERVQAVAEANKKAAKDSADAWKDYSEKAAQAVTDFNQKAARSQEDYDLARAKDLRDFNQKQAQDAKDAADKAEKAAQDHYDRLKELQDRFLFDLEDAVRERDARKALDLIRQHNLDVAEINTKYAEDQAAAKVEQAQKQADAAAAFAQDQADKQAAFELDRKRAQEDLQIQLADLRKQYDQRLAEIQAALAEEIKAAVAAESKREQAAIDQKKKDDDKAAQDYQDAKTKVEQQRADALIDLANYQRDQYEVIAAGLTDQYTLNADKANQLYQLLNAYYGPQGFVIKMFEALQAAAAAIVIQPSIGVPGAGGPNTVPGGPGGGGVPGLVHPGVNVGRPGGTTVAQVNLPSGGAGVGTREYLYWYELKTGRDLNNDAWVGRPSIDKTPSIYGYGEGGSFITKGPTLAMFGEGRDPNEVVTATPVSKFNQAFSGGDQHHRLDVHVTADEHFSQDFEDKVIDAIASVVENVNGVQG